MDDFDEDDEGPCEPLKATDAAALDLKGRAFLHQQGATVTRGWVESLSVTETQWTLALRDVEYLDRKQKTWSLKRHEDVYDGHLDYGYFYLYPDGRLQIGGYGMITHVAPPTSAPWTDYDWPELDNYPGGPMTS